MVVLQKQFQDQAGGGLGPGGVVVDQGLCKEEGLGRPLEFIYKFQDRGKGQGDFRVVSLQGTLDQVGEGADLGEDRDHWGRNAEDRAEYRGLGAGLGDDWEVDGKVHLSSEDFQAAKDVGCEL